VGYGDKTILARCGAGSRATACDKCLATVDLEANSEPRNGSPNDPFWHSTLAAPEAIVDDVDQRGLPSLRCSGDYVNGARLETQDATSTIVAKKNDVQQLQAHGRTPISAIVVAALPVEKNHLPRNSAR